MSPPRFSICISTRDRTVRLAAAVERIWALEGRESAELLVVDNGSSDGTDAMLRRMVASSPMPMKALNEPRPGVSHALNTALLASAGAIVILTDDDCLVRPDLLRRYAAIFADPRLGYAGGTIELHDPADFPIAISFERERIDLPPHEVVKPGLIQGANMAFRREALLEIGGFDPNFGAGAPFSGFDVDACGRASACGWAGCFDPGPAVAHHHGRKRAAAMVLLDRYRRGAGAYYAKAILDSPWRGRICARWLRASAWHATTQPRRFTAEMRGALAYVQARRRGALQPMDPRLQPVPRRAAAPEAPAAVALSGESP
jgi:glycosyltransferase involved in cell wall biosynthesis